MAAFSVPMHRVSWWLTIGTGTNARDRIIGDRILRSLPCGPIVASYPVVWNSLLLMQTLPC